MTDWLRYAEGIPPFSGKLNIVLFIPSLIPAFVEKKKRVIVEINLLGFQIFKMVNLYPLVIDTFS